ncbi:MAG: acetyl-CoA carboxylase biotin carboxyl carrier protein subunit [Maribacter sp.]|nr:acetyl-CoA carboxylase biotin carboxyl carrier protein subunit [Maribacter sp.]
MTDYLVTVDKEEIRVSKTAVDALDIIKVNGSDFHVLHHNQAYGIRLSSSHYLQKAFRIVVNGNSYEVNIEDAYDQRVKKMGLLATTSQKVTSIKAPMPGLIIDVMIVEGQTVSEGTPMLVLAAMKMENIILSQGAGIVKSIEVKKDDTVEKGQLIIEME